MDPGSTLKYTGGSHAIIYDKSWIEIGKIEIEESNVKILSGENSITIDYEHTKDSDLGLEIYTLGNPKRINKNMEKK